MSDVALHAKMTRKLITRIRRGDLASMLDLFAEIANMLIERIEHLEAQLATAERKLSKAPPKRTRFPKLHVVKEKL